MPRKIAYVFAAAMFAGALTVIPAAPASAVTSCSSWQGKSFNLPNKPDMTVWARNCIYKDGTYRRARIEYEWADTGWFGRRFDKFIVKPRLERNDADYSTASCDITSKINDSTSSDKGTCYATAYYSSLSGGWTADGSVTYNIDADGLGDRGWSLTGSPAVS